MATNVAANVAANAKNSEPTLTIIFGCLTTVLALAGIVVGYVQYRSYNRPLTAASSRSSLEAGLQLSAIIPGNQPQEQDETGLPSSPITPRDQPQEQGETSLPPSPIIPDGQTQEQPESDPAPKSDDVEFSSTPSDSDTARTLDSRSPVEIARGST
ncbi:hypothetical protein Q7P36_005323 [Cladosporium allicinum]